MMRMIIGMTIASQIVNNIDRFVARASSAPRSLKKFTAGKIQRNLVTGSSHQSGFRTSPIVNMIQING